MNKYSLECTYCGHNWEENKLFYAPSCPRCRDKKIKIKEITSKKIDYYEGSPPFSKQELKNYEKNDAEDDDYGFPWSGGD